MKKLIIVVGVVAVASLLVASTNSVYACKWYLACADEADEVVEAIGDAAEAVYNQAVLPVVEFVENAPDFAACASRSFGNPKGCGETDGTVEDFSPDAEEGDYLISQSPTSSANNTVKIEPAINSSVLSVASPSFSDGRLNNRDPGATAVVYCAANGVKVLGIDANSHGYDLFTVSKASIRNSIAAATSSKRNVRIVTKEGQSLWALTSNQLAFHGNDGKYQFVFEGNSCG